MNSTVLLVVLLLFFFRKKLNFNLIHCLFLRYCVEDSLDKHSVKGKIVLCDLIQASDDVGILSGPAGVIFGLNYPQDLRGTYALPALQIAQRDQRLIHSYITSTRYKSMFYFSFSIGKNKFKPTQWG